MPEGDRSTPRGRPPSRRDGARPLGAQMPEYTPDEFAALLMRAAAKAPREAVDVVRRGAANVKRDARRNVQQTAPVHNAHAYLDINFDVEVHGVTVEAEIGYDQGPGKAGNLGNLLEYGGGGDHSPPHRDLGRALDVEAPRFIEAIGDMGERLLS